MRFLHLIFAAFLLVSSAASAACHSVGDVHIICKDGQISALYVENDNDTAQNTDNKTDCCPMAGFALPMATFAALPMAAVTSTQTRFQRGMHMLRLDAHAAPRGPPARLFF
jgi:hypothetical protein